MTVESDEYFEPTWERQDDAIEKFDNNNRKQSLPCAREGVARKGSEGLTKHKFCTSICAAYN